MRISLPFALIGLVVLGCGKQAKPDDCQTFVDKSAPVLREMAKAAGKEVPKDALAQILKDCREGKDKRKDQAMFDCVVAAANRDAVATCWQDAMTDYRDPVKDVPGGRAGRAGGGEGELQLNRLAKMAKVYYVQNGAYPEGSTGLTPECCAQPTHECTPDPARWTGLWEKLEFSIDDVSHAQYSYEGTATTFVAKALVDADCDGEPAVVTATGTAEAGTPAVTIETSGSD